VQKIDKIRTNFSRKNPKVNALKPGMLPELNALFEEKKAPKNRKKTEKTGKKPKKPEKMGKKRQEAGTLIYKIFSSSFIILYIYYYTFYCYIKSFNNSFSS
jgi:hypothetical protein